MVHKAAIVVVNQCLHETGNPAIQNLTGDQINASFAQTLQDLMGEGENPSKDNPMYRGLLWLKEQADRLDIMILVPTELNYDWVQEILLS